MSTGEVRRVSRQDIQLVQNLIERCLQLYMNQKEVVNTLLIQAKIEPSFTELVWQKLEEENREFFKAYHVRLMVKNQIKIFNELLEKQAQLMREIQPTGVAPSSLSNGSNPPSLQQIPLPYASASRQDHSHCSVLPSTVINGARPAHHGIQLTNGGTSISTGRTDITPAVLPPNQIMHMGMLQGMNGTAVKLEPDYSSNTDFAFCADSFLDQRPATEEAAGTSFSCSDLGGQPSNYPLLETDPPSFGFLSQIPRNFSFSDLTDHFNQSADILETYGKSPFLGPGSDDFSVSPKREYQGEDKKLDTITERYDGFGSD